MIFNKGKGSSMYFCEICKEYVPDEKKHNRKKHHK